MDNAHPDSLCLNCRPLNEYFACGDKSLVERVFFKIVQILGRLYNFHYFVIIFSLMKVTVICRRVTYFTDSERIEYY